MTPDTARLHQQHEYLEAGFALAVRRAARGIDPALERRLQTQARSLRVMLDDRRAAAAVLEATEAACRVMDCLDAEAPLRMLAMARENLARHVRRSSHGRPRQAA